MSRKLFSLLAGVTLLGTLFHGATVFAQAKAAAPAGGDNVQYKSKTVYDFDDDTVEGDLVRPDGEFVDTRKGAKHSSLIKIRENFIPEMIKSAEDI
jgi:hypothetical protein